MRLRVTAYDRTQNYHICEEVPFNSLRNDHRVDLYVDNDKALPIKPEDLVGKLVDVEWLSPFLELGQGVTLVEEDGEELKP
jgi:hypothetical protein